MSGNYPAGVTNADPHFDLPSVTMSHDMNPADEDFDPAEAARFGEVRAEYERGFRAGIEAAARKLRAMGLGLSYRGKEMVDAVRALVPK